MTRLFTDGAEMGDTLSFDSVTDPGELSILSTNSFASPYYYRINTTSVQGSKARVFIPTTTEIYTRQRIRLDGLDADANVVAFYNSITLVARIGFKLGTFVWSSLSSTTVLEEALVAPLSSVWYETEVYFKLANAPNGRFVLYVDGNKVLDFTGDTMIAAPATFESIEWGMKGTGQISFDDLAINDTTGEVDNTWCGDGIVVKTYPSGSGIVNNFLNSGSTSGSSNYTYVDEFPSDGDTSYAYVSASSIGNKDQYRMSTFDGAGKTITRIYPEARIKKTRGDNSTIEIGYLPSGGTDQLSGSQVVGLDYARVVGTSASTNPVTGLAWTASDLNLLEYIIKK